MFFFCHFKKNNTNPFPMLLIYHHVPTLWSNFDKSRCKANVSMAFAGPLPIAHQGNTATGAMGSHQKNLYFGVKNCLKKRMHHWSHKNMFNFGLGGLDWNGVFFLEFFWGIFKCCMSKTNARLTLLGWKCVAKVKGVLRRAFGYTCNIMQHCLM